MATASMVTLGAMLFATSPAGAGNCPAPVSGDSEYTGAAGTDSTVMITVGAGESLTLTDDSAFGLDVANGGGIAIRSASTTGAITLDLDGNIKAQQNTIDINQDGTGAVSVTTRGAITSTSGKGISAETVDSSGGVTINSNAGISAMIEKTLKPPCSNLCRQHSRGSLALSLTSSAYRVESLQTATVVSMAKYRQRPARPSQVPLTWQPTISTIQISNSVLMYRCTSAARTSLMP